MLFARFARTMLRKGTLIMIDHDGMRYQAGDGAEPVVTVRFHDPKLGTRLFLNPALAAGEGYMDGTLTIEGEQTVYDLLDLILMNVANFHGHFLARSIRWIERAVSLIKTYNPAGRSVKNVAHHYDLSSTLYELFLDPDLQYSMAYWEDGEQMSLEDAQAAKLDHIAAKLCLQPGMRVLEIGCGWGGLGLRLNRLHDVDVVGITLSEEQLKVAQARTAQAGVDDRVDFRFQDYREVTETFDRVVSVGMFEHVGLPHFKSYFEAVRDRMTDDGVALIHTIGRGDGPGVTDGFTAKYIFPGGYAPAMSEVLPHIERARMFVTDVEVLRLHYAYTLKEWRCRFMENRAQVEKLYDARFCRMWEFFLASSEAAFRHAYAVNFQFQLCKTVDAVPLTRGYMYR